MSSEDLDQYIKKIEKSLTRAKNKDLGIVDDETKVRWPSRCCQHD